MREIEIKFKVENSETIMSFLEKHKCKLGTPIQQRDTIYVGNLNDTESKEGAVFMRVRQTDDMTELTYKRRSINKIEAQEIEFGIDSYEKANEFLKAIGFKEWVQVNKRRTPSKYAEFNLCLDEVERLGAFLEIELLIENEDDISYEEKILELAEEMGLTSNDRIDNHYDTMIAELG